tara:strand:- start:1264 stop:1449 length:186 start_codon:yes stop_codon:yes gene_type:complete
MAKRKIPKNYLVSSIRNLSQRLYNVELVMSKYIEYKKDDEDFKKFIEKEYKDKTTVQDEKK